ncbi:cell adhesion molecule Dscam1 isoform X1 [Hetaerina americana]|uniref:cell adhesion molecule Dscam1 isoform X1 n=1 Tax=Hetaerina americana TaxID=62018 RepID=UPI003A7F3188
MDSPRPARRSRASTREVWRLLFLVVVYLTTSTIATEEAKDTREGEDVTLECRFRPQIAAQAEVTFFWLRINRRNHDNVAIQKTPLNSNYKLDFRPELGRYDLLISNASYERDNGRFECRVKAAGSGTDIHSQAFRLTVLTRPSPPRAAPAAPIATEGKPLSLTCSSTGGSPDPEIRWYKDGVSQPLDATVKSGGSRDAPTTAILALTPQKGDDGAVYRCVVWNRAMGEGEKMEATVTLNVNYYPRVEVGPENPLRVEVDSTAILQCSVDAKPPANGIRWSRNGRYVSSSATHTLRRVSLTEAGAYTCSADNGLGRPGDATLSLDVLHGPTVTVEQSREAEEGDAVTARCEVSANPPPVSVEWFREGSPEFRQSGSTLRLTRVSALEAGRYVCKAVNVLSTGSSGRRSGNATLTLRVRHRPGKARITPDRPVAVEGGGVTLTCAANPPGWPAPQFRWWREGSETAVATGAMYTITTAHLTNEGTYHCQPSNDVGVGTIASVLLRVHQPPRFMSKLQPHVTRKAGDTNLSVTCAAQGKPRPIVRWMKDAEEIAVAGSTLGEGIESEMGAVELYKTTQEESEGRAGIVTVQSTLYFTGPGRPQGDRLLPSDRGRYSCVFENEVKRAESVMQLRIEHPPIALHQYNKVAYDIREAGYIVCEVQAYPKPEFQWSFAGMSLDPKSNNHYSVNTTALSGDIHRSVLHVSGVWESDYGEYSCRAANGMGALKASLRLQPKGPPERPGVPSATPLGPGTVSLRWTPGFDGGIHNTKYFIAYRKIGANDESPECQHQFGYNGRSYNSIGANAVPSMDGRDVMLGGWEEYDCQRNNPCNVTSLQQHHTYVFKVKAYNTKGNSNYSDEVTATTKVDRLPEPQRVTYDPKSRIVTINIASSCLQFVGLIEATDERTGEWHHAETVVISGTTLREVELPDRDIEDISAGLGSIMVHTTPPSNLERHVRVRLCLQSNQDICGEYVEAEIGPSYIKEASILPTPTLIAIIVSCVVFVLFVGLLLIFCRCKRNQKKVKKEYEMESSTVRPNIVTQQPPPPYYPSGMENKGLEQSMDLVGDDTSKNPVYNGGSGQNGYGYHGNPPAGNNINGGEWVNMGYMDNSYSNSNNGGSVNSQDSLWQVKNGGGGSSIGGGPNGDIQHGHHIQAAQPMIGQQQGLPMHHHPERPYAYDPLGPPPNHIGSYGGDDYGHYPPPPPSSATPSSGAMQPMSQGEDYLNQRNRDYMGPNSGGPNDAYAPIHKQKKRMDHIDSPYHDVSGLPDPYLDQDSDENKTQHVSLSFDESLESGYSTPNSRNRRVIREIIV